MLHPQGKNIKENEFNALGEMLSSVSWEMPQAQEYQNDLVQPDFLDTPGVSKSTSTSLMPLTDKKPDPAGPATDDQWKKVNKMVA